jgi:hypothetical protein
MKFGISGTGSTTTIMINKKWCYFNNLLGSPDEGEIRRGSAFKDC